MAIHPLSPAQPVGTAAAAAAAAPNPVTPAEPTTPTRAPRLPAGGVITGVTLAISLNGEPSSETKVRVRRATVATASSTAASINRRDSLKRREALLRGKEGSRRRQRWENDRLLSNPHAVPPSAADWEPRPLHPKRDVPYEYASLWDSPAFQKRQQHQKHQKPVDKVPKDLKARLERSHGAIGLLQALEEDVRKFVLGTQEREKAEQMKAGDRPESPVHVNIEDVEDESDEEIVFVSKKMRYQIQRQESVKSFIEELATEKILFESLLSDPSASFGRWLVHSIASYYGLKSWSVTTGNPAKRLAYVGLKKDNTSAPLAVSKGMPKPLYLML